MHTVEVQTLAFLSDGQTGLPGPLTGGDGICKGCSCERKKVKGLGTEGAPSGLVAIVAFES